MKKYLADMITGTRIVLALITIFLDIRSDAFLIIYGIAGFTDVLDGYVARKLHTESDLGRKLDSVSDLLLYGIMLRKAWSILEENLPVRGLYAIMGILLFRLLMYVFYGLRFHHLMSTHSCFNKASGFLTFMLPFVFRLGHVEYYCYFVMLVGSCSNVYDFIYFMKSMMAPAHKTA